MVSPVSASTLTRPAATPGNADVLRTMQPNTKTLARSETGGGPGKGQITSTPQFVQLMGKSPALRRVPYADYATSIKSAGGVPQPVRPGSAYFRVLTGSEAGRIVDLSAEKFPGKYMPSATKIDLMEYGFGQAGLKKIGGVTFDQFAKSYSYYRQTLEESGGSNTGAVRGALKEYQALGDKAFPNGPPKKAALVPTKVGDLSPYLQGEIRAGRMTFAEAVQLMKREAIRRETMDDAENKFCETRVTVQSTHDLRNGKVETDSVVSGRTLSSGWVLSTKTEVTAQNPQTKKKLGGAKSGDVPGYRSAVQFETNFVQDYSGSKPSPAIKAKGSCTFPDGTTIQTTPVINNIDL